MYSTFISPTEFSPTSLEIKRALLTFDKVYLPDPSDRDYIPPQAFTAAIFEGLGLPSIMGIHILPVRPLAKSVDYDRDFEATLKAVQYHRRSDLIDVISTYEQTTSVGDFFIGGTPIGGYPLDLSFMLWSYRDLVRDNTALLSAILPDKKLLSANEEYIASLSAFGLADGEIVGDPALPMIEGPLACENLRPALSSIARARVAAVMKTIGFCAAKELVPSFREKSYSDVARHIAGRAGQVIDKISEFDEHWSLRNRVLNIAHREYINEDVLDKISIEDVIKLRTRAWGAQAESRDILLQSVARVARECESAADFDLAVQQFIDEYRKTHDDILSERKALGFQIKCDLAKAATGIPFAVISGEYAGMLTQMQTGLGAAAVLSLGACSILDKIKDYKPILDEINAIESNFSDSACFGIHDFYQRF